MLVRIEPLKSFIAARSLLSSIGTTTILTRRDAQDREDLLASEQDFQRDIAQAQKEHDALAYLCNHVKYCIDQYYVDGVSCRHVFVFCESTHFDG